jgi:hypothetical protein
MKKAIYSNGVTTYVDMTEEEIAELNIQPVNNWHSNTLFRIVMTYEDNIKLLQLHPGFAQYVVDAGLLSIPENGYTYIYVNYVYDDHRALFNQLNDNGFNIQIEPNDTSSSN